MFAYTPLRRCLLPLTAALLAARCGSLAAAESPFAFHEITSASLELTESGKPVFVYNSGGILAPGFPEIQGKREVVRIEDGASNPGYPKNGWLMRHSFALLNVSYPGLEPLTLRPGKPLVLKYRVILSSGKAAD